MVDVPTYTTVKDSGIDWIGDIPESWNVRTIYQLASQVKCKNSDLRENNLLSLSYGKIKRKDINAPEGLLPASFDGYNIIEAGDIVLRLTDLQNDHTSLRVGLSTERGIITSAYITLRPLSIRHSKYIYYLLHAFDLKKGFYGMGSGVRQGLNYGEVKELRVVLPSDTEQDAITTYLDDQCGQIDSVIEETKASIEEYKTWKASIIDEAVTKDLDPSVGMKDSGTQWVEKIPSTWRVVPLKSEFNFGKGLPITKADLVDEGVPVISYGQIHSKKNPGTRIVPELLRYVPEKYLESNPASLAKRGDIFIADTSEDLAGIGNAAYVDTDDNLFAGYHTIIARPNHPEYAKYLSYLFLADNWRRQLRMLASGIKVFSVTQTILRKISILIPTQPEQIQICGCLDDKCLLIDEIIAEKQLMITDLEAYKKSLIYETVTGKRKVV